MAQTYAQPQQGYQPQQQQQGYQPQQGYAQQPQQGYGQPPPGYAQPQARPTNMSDLTLIGGSQPSGRK